MLKMIAGIVLAVLLASSVSAAFYSRAFGYSFWWILALLLVVMVVDGLVDRRR